MCDYKQDRSKEKENCCRCLWRLFLNIFRQTEEKKTSKLSFRKENVFVLLSVNFAKQQNIQVLEPFQSKAFLTKFLHFF